MVIEQREVKLVWTDLSGMPQARALSDQPLVIGRSDDADLVLDCAGVSRQHAELSRDGRGQWWVRDLGSRNGTYVNGLKLVDRHQLSHGDHIGIGELTLRLTTDDLYADHDRTGTNPATSVTVVRHDLESTSFDTLQGTTLPKIESRQLFALHAFGRELLEEPDAANRERRLCELMLDEGFPAHSGAILRLMNDTEQPKVLAIAERLGIPGAASSMYISYSVLARLRTASEPVLASNVARFGDDSASPLSLAPETQTLTIVACPLRQIEQGQDVFYAELPPNCGTQEWLALASLIVEQFRLIEMAWQARLAAEKQARLERDLDQARRIQQGLVPRDVRFDGLDVGMSFRPCLAVGGDYVDAVVTANGQVLLIVGDVCGKGLPAALLASGLHTWVHACVATETGLDRMSQMFNEYLLESMTDATFITAVAVLLDPATGALEYVNAGHPPPLVASRDGGVRDLQSGLNMPLGVASQTLDVQRDELREGECLVLYTDGLTEARGVDGELLYVDGVRRLLETVVTEHGHEPAPRLAELFQKAVTDATAQKQADDDQTVLLACRT